MSMSIAWEAKCSFHNYFKKHAIFTICVEKHCNRMCDLDHIPVLAKGKLYNFLKCILH